MLALLITKHVNKKHITAETYINNNTVQSGVHQYCKTCQICVMLFYTLSLHGGISTFAKEEEK